MKVNNVNDIDWDYWDFDKYMLDDETHYATTYFFFSGEAKKYVAVFDNIWYNEYNEVYEYDHDKGIGFLEGIYEENGKELKGKDFDDAIEILEKEYGAEIELN